MTGLVESTTADDQSERGEVRETHGPDTRDSSRRGRTAAGSLRSTAGAESAGCPAGPRAAWPSRGSSCSAPGEVGSKSDWFFGAAVLCAVLVVMWQTVNVQRQANASGPCGSRPAAP